MVLFVEINLQVMEWILFPGDLALVVVLHRLVMINHRIVMTGAVITDLQNCRNAETKSQYYLSKNDIW